MPRQRLLTMLAATTLIAAGCSSPTDKPDGDGGLTVTSCGKKVSIPQSPERVVTMDQSSTETLLKLGLHDRMIGTSNLKTKITPQYRDSYDDIPVISPDIPTAEQLREAGPDLVVSGFESHFTTDRVGTRDELHELGLASYVSAADCPNDNDADLTAFDRLFIDYENYGEIFDIEERAAELVDDQRETVDSAADTKDAVTDNPSVVWIYSVYDGKPFVAGSGSMASDMSRLAGVDNVFDDVNEAWPEVSWEEVAERDPDMVVVGDLSQRGQAGDSADEKLALMRDDPAVSKLTALQSDHIIEVPGIELDPSVRTVNTLELFLDGVEDLGYVG